MVVTPRRHILPAASCLASRVPRLFHKLRLEGLFVFVPLGHLVRGNFGPDEIRRNLFQHLLVFG
jgi:hypothetical protein